MPPEPTQAAKLCTVCGIDCTGRPRSKDAQGRYVCKDCLDKAKEAKVALKTAPAATRASSAGIPLEPSEQDNSFLLNLGSSSIASSGTKPCPECGRALTTETVLCIGCGYNLETGKRLPVKVIKAKQEKTEKASSGSGRSFNINPTYIVVAIFFVMLALFGIGTTEPTVMVIFAGLAVLLWLGAWLTVVISAFMDSLTAGLLSLLFGPYLLYWLFLECESSFVKQLFGVAFISIVLMYFGMQYMPAAGP